MNWDKRCPAAKFFDLFRVFGRGFQSIYQSHCRRVDGRSAVHFEKLLDRKEFLDNL